jgi:hypothetical protein
VVRRLVRWAVLSGGAARLGSGRVSSAPPGEQPSPVCAPLPLKSSALVCRARGGASYRVRLSRGGAVLRPESGAPRPGTVGVGTVGPHWRGPARYVSPRYVRGRAGAALRTESGAHTPRPREQRFPRSIASPSEHCSARAPRLAAPGTRAPVAAPCFNEPVLQRTAAPKNWRSRAPVLQRTGAPKKEHRSGNPLTPISRWRPSVEEGVPEQCSHCFPAAGPIPYS